MRFKNGKFHIKKEDLGRRIILIKNYMSDSELASVQTGIMDAAKFVLPIPIESFDKYNAFRVKNKMKPLELKGLEVYDIKKMKEERAMEETKTEK